MGGKRTDERIVREQSGFRDNGVYTVSVTGKDEIDLGAGIDCSGKARELKQST